MLRQDEEGRYKLSQKEVYALLCYAAATGELATQEQALWERLGKIPNGRRDWKMLEAVTVSLLNAILDTVPTKKLFTFNQELKGSKMAMYVNPAAIHADGVTCVKDDDMVAIVNYLLERNCLLCDNEGGNVRGCRLRKLIDKVVPYDCDPLENGSCPFEGCDTVDVVKGEYVD